MLFSSIDNIYDLIFGDNLRKSISIDAVEDALATSTDSTTTPFAKNEAASPHIRDHNNEDNITLCCNMDQVPEMWQQFYRDEKQARESQHQVLEFTNDEIQGVIKAVNTYVTCPNESCNFAFEYAGKGELASARVRCRLCLKVFCAECKASPYHEGQGCSKPTPSSQQACRFCDVPLDGTYWDEDNLFHYLFEEEASKLLEHPNFIVNSCCSNPACFSLSQEVCWDKTECGHYCHLPKEHDKYNCESGKYCCEASCVTKRRESMKFRETPEKSEATKEELYTHVTLADDCSICFSTLREGSILPLTCGHVFHYKCVCTMVDYYRQSPLVAFKSAQCPLCNDTVSTPVPIYPLNSYLCDVKSAKTDIYFRVLQQAEVEKMELTVDENDERKVVDFGLQKFNFYKCFQCKSFYYGGKRECGEESPLEASAYMCAGCGPTCAEHGSDYILWKCKYCCKVANWNCFGHTHFCEPCHARAFQWVQGDNSNRVKQKLSSCCGGPDCPLGVEHHSPNGEEFSLGCGLCGKLSEVKEKSVVYIRDHHAVNVHRPARRLRDRDAVEDIGVVFDFDAEPEAMMQHYVDQPRRRGLPMQRHRRRPVRRQLPPQRIPPLPEVAEEDIVLFDFNADLALPAFGAAEPVVEDDEMGILFDFNVEPDILMQQYTPKDMEQEKEVVADKDEDYCNLRGLFSDIEELEIIVDEDEDYSNLNGLFSDIEELEIIVDEDEDYSNLRGLFSDIEELEIIVDEDEDYSNLRGLLPDIKEDEKNMEIVEGDGSGRLGSFACSIL